MNRLALVVVPLAASALAATAQVAGSTVDKNSPIAFERPQTGSRAWDLERVAGQVVFARTGQWYQAATRMNVYVYDPAQSLVAKAVSDATGKFSVPNLPPGKYTLVTGAHSLHALSLALRTQGKTAGRESSQAGLMLYLRATDDKRASSVSAIQSMELRAELLEMVRKDQDWRMAWIKQRIHEGSSRDKLGKHIDAANLSRMKAITRRYGWPGPDLVGVDGTEAAFLLVQHAPLTFEERMLPYVERAWRSNELSGQDYALLRDRTLIREGKEQIYGTQGVPFKDWKNGEPALSPIEDEAHVGKRRAAVGLMPLADYKAMLKKIYMPTGAPPAAN